MQVNKPNETLIRISIDAEKNPIEWDMWVRSNNRSPWAFILGGNATTVDQARRNAYKSIDNWVKRIEDSSISIDIINERKGND